MARCSLTLMALSLSVAPQMVVGAGACSGDPCRDSSHCRSKWGWCGSSEHYCNKDSIWKSECDNAGTTTQKVGTTTGFLAPTTTTTTEFQAPTPTDFVPCTYSKTFTHSPWPIQQDSTDVEQMVSRCEGQTIVNTADSATCIINSHAAGYDYDRWTPQAACPYPLGQSPEVSQAECQAEFTRWKNMGVRMVSLPGGISAMTGIGHGILNGVRGECALMEFQGRYAVIFQVDIRSWSLEVTEQTLLHLTNDVNPGGHCFAPKVKAIDCATVGV